MSVLLIFHDRTDKNIAGTSAGVLSAKRIIRSRRQEDTFVKIKN